MPVFSSNSPVRTWPSRAEVIDALKAWAARQRDTHPELIRVGYFGSLADGKRYGFGSDADVVAVVRATTREHWWERPLDFDPPREVPVDVDLFVYTDREFAGIVARDDAFARDMRNVVWCE